MKTNWSIPIAIASLVLALLTLVLNMNRVSETDARQLRDRLTAIEGRIAPQEKAIDRTDARLDAANAALAEHNLRIDRLEREPKTGGPR